MKVKEVIKQLDIENSDTTKIIGIQYSILKWSTVFRDANIKDLESITKTLRRLFEDGHAECFSYEKKEDDSIKYITSGIDDEWVFNEIDDPNDQWLNNTKSTDTAIYYVEVDDESMANFYSALEKLKNTPVDYALLYPNIPYSGNRFENCVSSSHYLLNEAGIGWYVKGWWMPSFDSLIQWASLQVPVLNTYNGNTWKYTKIENTNCYF